MALLYHFDEFLLDRPAFALTRLGQPVSLEPKAFDLLRYFLDHPNRIITKQELLDAIWKDVSVTENVLARAVVLVRKALGDDARMARFVRTIPTRGYKFVAPPTLRTSDAERQITSDPEPAMNDGVDLPIAIAVLPFVNASGDSTTEHFSDGISEDILNALAHDTTLRVAARSSSFAWRGGAVDVQTIAERLRVAFVLDGSARRTGDRVRITAQLIDAKTGYQRWSRQFDRDLTDIFAVQDEIANAVASATRETLQKQGGGLSSAVNPTVNRRDPPCNLDAYEVFLKGRYLSHQRFVVMGEARACFRRAIALDPTFAPAYAALSENYGLCGLYAALPPTEAFLAMRRFAEEAHVRAPELADPHYLLASVSLWFEWNVCACDRHLRRALAIEPNHTGALTLAAMLSALRRQPKQAWMAADQAERVDPLGTETRTWLLAVAWLTGDFERQVKDASRLIDEHPGYSDAFRWRSMAYTVRGEYGLARADLETFGALTNMQLYTLVGLGVVAALEGNIAEARRIIDVMLERASREWVPPMVFGQIEQQLGNYDAALGWYERAYQTRFFHLAALHIDPQFRIVPPGRTGPISEHPRWTMLLQRIGVALECPSMDAPSSFL